MTDIKHRIMLIAVFIMAVIIMVSFNNNGKRNNDTSIKIISEKKQGTYTSYVISKKINVHMGDNELSLFNITPVFHGMVNDDNSVEIGIDREYTQNIELISKEIRRVNGTSFLMTLKFKGEGNKVYQIMDTDEYNGIAEYLDAESIVSIPFVDKRLVAYTIDATYSDTIIARISYSRKSSEWHITTY